VLVHVACETFSKTDELYKELPNAKAMLSANMTYKAHPEMIRLADEIVTALLGQTLSDSGTSSSSVLDIRTVFRRNSVRQGRRAAIPGSHAIQSIFFTDLQPDDCMAMVQLLHLKAQRGVAVNPAIVFCTDFAADKDEEKVFELKILLMVLMLGINMDVYILDATDPKKPIGYDTRAAQVKGQREATLKRLCDKVSKHEGEIELYIITPTRGNFAAFVDTLAKNVGSQRNIAMKQRWSVTVSSDKHNMRGFTEADRKALNWIMSRGKEPIKVPLLDISKHTFFGGDKSHPMTTNFSSFVGESFGSALAEKSPLLVAVLHQYTELTSAFAIKPDEKLFRKDKLSKMEQEEMDEISKLYNTGKLKDYAEKFVDNEDLCRKLSPKKKNALHSYLSAGSEAPFGSQVIYLYEWAKLLEDADLVEDVRGTWVLTDQHHTEVLPGMAQGHQTLSKRQTMLLVTDQHCTEVRPGVAQGGQFMAVQPKLKLPRDEGGLEKLRNALIEGTLASLDDLEEVANHEQHTLSGPGNLCYSTPKVFYEEALRIVNRGHLLHTKDTLRWLLRDIGRMREPAPGGADDSRLMVVFTDLEPDDTMAIAQLWRWKVEQLAMHRPPIIVFTVDFLNKDAGLVFEKKLLVAALVLGAVPFYVISCRGEEHSEILPEKAERWMKERKALLEQLATDILSFRGDQVDLYLMSPARGALADMESTLQSRGCWPLKASWNVSMYSGKFNMVGFHQDDIETLRNLVMNMSKSRTLVDVAKWPFFGGDQCDKVTASLSSFAKEGFAADLSTAYPLLAAALKLLSDEYNWSLVNPKHLFVHLPEEKQSELPALQKDYEEAHQPEQLAAFAHKIFNDEDLFRYVKNVKKSTLQAFAYHACDSPLCDQLLFLYEWLLEKGTSLLAKHDAPGRWILPEGKKYSIVEPVRDQDYKYLPHELRAIQPVLRYPLYKQGLDSMREALNDYLLNHLDAMERGHEARLAAEASGRRSSCGAVKISRGKSW